MKCDVSLKVCRLFVLLCILSGAAQAARPVNLIVVLADDQGWGDLSINGNANLKTPHIDSLARDGVRFDRFYVCPVCSPTRAEFLTGRYHVRARVYSTSQGGERMNLDEQTLAEVFKQAGYATGAFGKWHNGMQYPYHPNARGFDEFYGFCSGHWGNYFSPMLEHNGRIVQGEGFVIDDFTSKAIQFIKQQVKADKPFLAYLPYNTPHSPMQVPDAYWNRFAHKDLTHRHRDPEREDVAHTRAALAMCENIDWNVGRLLKTLDDLQISKQTLVVYFSDNGPNGWRWNGGMAGKKGATDEGGVRSPLFMRWPGTLHAGQVVSQVSAAIDLLPTLANLADITYTPKNPLDGVALSSLLNSSDASWPERMIFSHWNQRVSVRTQQFRLDHRGRLFDIDRDPGQYHDVSQQYPEETSRLSRAVAQWKQDLLPDLTRDPRPFVICHPDAVVTQLPARDARIQGTIRRSNRWPNCSYFTHWTSPQDRITWDVEVGATGQYAVEIYYACAPQDLGATLKLSFQDSVLQGRVTEAHDPPLRGAEHDRTPRMESYVKAFAPMKLGTIGLQQGTGTLILQAPSVPHAQAMEFRLLTLTRVD